MKMLYVLHFDSRLSHAEHYIGITSDLRNRLAAHESGHGSALTRHLHDTGATWRLATLYQAPDRRAAEIERLAKDQHNGPRYCAICNGREVPRLAGAERYPLGELPEEYLTTKNAEGNPNNPTGDRRDYQLIEPTHVGERVAEILAIRAADRDALGFMRGGIERAITERRIIVAMHKQKIVGYVLWTTNPDRLHIWQLAVLDGYRGRTLGRALVIAARAHHPLIPTMCEVRDDLPANEFWHKIGFEHVRSKKHETSGSTLNIYYAPPLTIPPITNNPSV